MGVAKLTMYWLQSHAPPIRTATTATEKCGNLYRDEQYVKPSILYILLLELHLINLPVSYLSQSKMCTLCTSKQFRC